MSARGTSSAERGALHTGQHQPAVAAVAGLGDNDEPVPHAPPRDAAERPGCPHVVIERAAPSPRSIPLTWLTYADASAYTGWSIPYLRNLVSAAQIPVYGPLRRRRFRRDMLDLFINDPDAAMRMFRLERSKAYGG